MNYSVKSTDVFEKQAKKLIKKYASLKNEFYVLIQNLKVNLNKVIQLGETVIKFAFQLQQKEKANRVVL
jgi:hypothetical protein